MSTSLLQRMHRQINATRVLSCTSDFDQTVIYHIKLRLGYFCCMLTIHIKLELECRNNECPACRTHCASRRSLRDDPNYDKIIAYLYPDIDKYEEEVQLTLFLIFLRGFIFLSSFFKSILVEHKH